MSNDNATIVYTLTDESPLLATASLLPIIRTFLAPAGIDVEVSDISLAARILANFPGPLAEDQRVPDALAELSGLGEPARAIVVVDADTSADELRRLDEQTAEVKRMYVAPEARRQGVARAVLAYLEEHARATGVTRLVLETGNEQPEALAFYSAAGYRPVTPYGFYRCYPDAHSLGKDLVVADAKDVANEGMYA